MDKLEKVDMEKVRWKASLLVQLGLELNEKLRGNTGVNNSEQAVLTEPKSIPLAKP